MRLCFSLADASDKTFDGMEYTILANFVLSKEFDTINKSAGSLVWKAVYSFTSRKQENISKTLAIKHYIII